MKKITVYAILAKDENGNEVIFKTGTRKEIESAYYSIVGDSRQAVKVETESGKYLVYGYGSKRTAHPEKIESVNLEAGLIIDRNTITEDPEELKELKTYHSCSYDSENIARELARLADAPEEAIQELDEAIFHIETYAQNEYNPDYFRILLNVLQTIADSSAMPF